MPAGLFLNYFNFIQTTNTFKNRYVIQNNIIFKYSQAYFQSKMGRKIRAFSLDRENNILIKKKRVYNEIIHGSLSY